MATIVGVRFQRAGRIHYYDPGDLDLSTGDLVIAETVRGCDVGRVVIAPRQVVLGPAEAPPRRLVRRATAQDLRTVDVFKAREADALARCKVKVAEHRLPMKLVRAEYNFDGSRLTFYFTAEGRVDFRALVRDLAGTFRTRIELRQIGPRDQAKLVGGLGRCGRELCCTAWLHDLPSTAIRMAKDQDLPINPSRITGSCGRLLCCLSFEHDAYATARRALPRLGQTVATPQGEGRVVALHILEQRYDVELASGQVIPVAVEPPETEAAACDACSGCPSVARV